MDPTTITGGVPGQIITLYPRCVPFCNTTSRAIVRDSGNFLLAGDAVLFPSDTLQLMAIPGGPFWIEVGRSDN